MSTRSITRVIENGRTVDIYHHHDGYPEGVGAHLLEVFKTTQATADDFVRALFKSDGEYEVTFARWWDVEYLYIIDFDEWPNVVKFARVKLPDTEPDYVLRDAAEGFADLKKYLATHKEEV